MINERNVPDAPDLSHEPANTERLTELQDPNSVSEDTELSEGLDIDIQFLNLTLNHLLTSLTSIS